MNGFFSSTFVLQVALLIFTAGGIITMLQRKSKDTDKRLERLEEETGQLWKSYALMDKQLGIMADRMARRRSPRKTDAD